MNGYMKLPKGFSTIVPPYNYQKEAIAYGIVNERAGLLLDLGLGKTFCAINIARWRIQQEQVKKVLVVVPATLLLNWYNEIKKYSEYEALILHHSSRLERTAMIKAFMKDNKYHFGIINYEALSRYSILQDMRFDTLISDESARYLRTPHNKTTNCAIAIANKIKYKLILTGTPIANRPLDIWSQFMILDGGKTFTDNYYKFRSWFFYPVDMGFNTRWILKPTHYGLLRKMIYSKCIRKTKAECLPDLPEQIFKVIEIEPDTEFKKLYTSVRKQVESEIETEGGLAKLNINNIFKRLTKLQQVTGGAIIDDSGKANKLKNTPKLDALSECLDEIIDAGESAIVWCRFRKSLEIIERLLRKKDIAFTSMHGGHKNKYERWKGFQEDPTISVFLGQIESGGIGIELFKINSDKTMQHMIFYETTFFMDIKRQAIGRIHRLGQRSICRYIDLIVKGTIDEKILNIYLSNKQVADAIIETGIGGFLS